MRILLSVAICLLSIINLAGGVLAGGPLDGGNSKIYEKPDDLYKAEIVCMTCRDAELLDINIRLRDEKAVVELLKKGRCAIKKNGVLAYKLKSARKKNACIALKPKGFNITVYTIRRFLAPEWNKD